jgi:putative ABC transport system substrate-binding protein
MKRREFISLVGAAVATPLAAARAQQPTVPVVGFLSQESAVAAADYVSAFQKGLAEIGYVEGRDVKVEYRWADGHYDRLPELSADLISRNVSAIAVAFAVAAVALKSATTTIPICFVSGVDPVRLGLVQSLNHPGGNATGVFQLTVAIGAKRLGLLHDLLPQVATIGLLINPNSPYVAEQQSAEIDEGARTLGERAIVFRASTDDDIVKAFSEMTEQKAGALIVAPDAFFHSRAEQIIALAMKHGIPSIFDRPDLTAAGGLMSYGADIAEVFHQQGGYIGRILKGEKPADLPVIQPTKFQFVINLRTAKALGITVPSGLMSIADEVIE